MTDLRISNPSTLIEHKPDRRNNLQVNPTLAIVTRLSSDWFAAMVNGKERRRTDKLRLIEIERRDIILSISVLRSLGGQRTCAKQSRCSYCWLSPHSLRCYSSTFSCPRSGQPSTSPLTTMNQELLSSHRVCLSICLCTLWPRISNNMNHRKPISWNWSASKYGEAHFITAQSAWMLARIASNCFG